MIDLRTVLHGVVVQVQVLPQWRLDQPQGWQLLSDFHQRVLEEDWQVLIELPHEAAEIN
jgi:hypothetical protein